MSQTLALQRFSPTIQSGTPKARLLILLGILGEWHTLQEEASAIFMLDLTTRSTPIFAFLINRINELRLNAGKSTVGFTNPALYSHPEMLNDITNGTNPGCGTAGFSAAPGWGPVTGLGKSAYRVGRKKGYTDSVRNSEFPKDGEFLHELAVDGQNDLEEYGTLVWCGIDFLEIYEVMIMPF